KVTPAQFTITITKPGPGGGTSAQAVSVSVENESPVLLSIQPREVTVRQTDLTLTLTGNNFKPTSSVNFGSLQLSPSAVSGTSMTVVIPASQLNAVGSVVVSVTNPAPGGGTTPAVTFDIQENTSQ